MSPYNFTSPASAQFTSDSGKPDKLVTTVCLTSTGGKIKLGNRVHVSLYDLTEEMFLVRARNNKQKK